MSEPLIEPPPVDAALVREAVVRVPPAWTLVLHSDDGAMFRRGTIQVILSLAYEQDGKIWKHVSACDRGGNRYRMPTWEDLKRVKNDFLGENTWAYQVLPPPADYININAAVLHLFALADGAAALPDFTRGGKSI